LAIGFVSIFSEGSNTTAYYWSVIIIMNNKTIGVPLTVGNHPLLVYPIRDWRFCFTTSKRSCHIILVKIDQLVIDLQHIIEQCLMSTNNTKTSLQNTFD
jgi:hypothetical protein